MVSQIKERLNFDTEWEPNSILVKKLLNREVNVVHFHPNVRYLEHLCGGVAEYVRRQ